jgi:dihydrofolate reductase
MNALPKLVASRTLTEADWNNTTVASDIAAAIRARKAKADKDKNLYVFGSAELVDSLLADGLIDEIMLCVAPIAIGKGTRHFKEGRAADLSLAEVRPLQTGGVILRYAVNR